MLRHNLNSASNKLKGKIYPHILRRRYFKEKWFTILTIAIKTFAIYVKITSMLFATVDQTFGAAGRVRDTVGADNVRLAVPGVRIGTI